MAHVRAKMLGYFALLCDISVDGRLKRACERTVQIAYATHNSRINPRVLDPIFLLFQHTDLLNINPESASTAGK